jgi:ketosteroid isomerase-like protein
METQNRTTRSGPQPIRCRSSLPGDYLVSGKDVTETFRFVASWFSDVRSYEWELLISDVSGDMAYTVAIERYTASREGQPPAPTELRVTHIYRREGGHWHAVHRHADLKRPDQAVT